MPRRYKDLIVDETDHLLRMNLLNRDGSVALRDVSVQVTSPVVQEGDRWGAKEANLLLELGDDGVPRLLVSTTASYTATIGTGWSGSAPYTQKIGVVGMLATDSPTVDIVLSGMAETDMAQLEAWGMVGRITTAEP